MGLALRSATVQRRRPLGRPGHLGVDREVPVGFTDIEVRIEVDADADEAALARLVEATERYCVVAQTSAGAHPGHGHPRLTPDRPREAPAQARFSPLLSRQREVADHRDPPAVAVHPEPLLGLAHRLQALGQRVELDVPVPGVERAVPRHVGVGRQGDLADRRAGRPRRGWPRAARRRRRAGRAPGRRRSAPGASARRGRGRG